MSEYLLVAGMALVLKLWLLIRVERYDWASSKWVGFVAALAALNFSELAIYLAEDISISNDHLLAVYFVCCLAALCFGLFYVSDFRRYGWQRVMVLAAAFVALVLGALFLFTDFLVVGAHHGVYPVSSIKGEWFSVFLWYALGVLSLLAFTLGHNYANSSRAHRQIAYLYTIAGMAMLVGVSVVVLVLMAFGLGGNGSLFIPLATTGFLLITSWGKRTDVRVIDPRRYSFIGPEARVARRLEQIESSITLGDSGLHDVLSEMELALIEYKIEKNSGNKSAAARDLGISRSSLHKKLRERT